MSEPQVKIIYRTYTPAAKRSISKYQKTEKGKLAVAKANKRYYLKNKEKMNAARREKYRMKKALK